MGATWIATIWKRSHLGEPGDALTFPFHLEAALQGRGGHMMHEDSFPPPKLCADHLPFTVGVEVRVRAVAY